MKRFLKSSRIRIALVIMIGSAWLGSFSWGESPGRKAAKLTIEGETCILRELGAIISESEEGSKVAIILPADQRPEGYAEVDLREGDIIMMLNGKRVENPGWISKEYDELAVGDKIKLGVRRNKEILMVELTKANPDKLPKMMIKRAGGDDDFTTTLLGVGIILKSENGKIVIDEVIPELSDKFGDKGPEKGDIISSIQGKVISGPEQLSEIYSEINIGDKVGMSINRGGQEISLSFTKEGRSGGKPLIIKK